MKAQHRHQLQTNALADRVGKILVGMKSSPRTTSPLPWVFLVLALGAIGVWQYFSQANQADRSLLWIALDGAQQDPIMGTANLTVISNEHAGTFPGRAASFDLARTGLEGAQAMLNSIQRSEAIKQLKEARDRYAKLATQCADSPLLAQEALMGVATANESLVGTDGPENVKEDLQQAISDYQKLATAYPDGYLGKEAARRVTRLEEQLPQVTKFYEDLNQLTAYKKNEIKPPLPPKMDSPSPLDSKGPDLPKLEDPKLEPKPAESTKAKDSKPADAPKPQEKAKESKPAETKAPEVKPPEKAKESKPQEPKKP